DTLYRVCLALAGDPALAERLVADALLKALDGLPSFTGDGAAFHVWLLRLAIGSAARRRPAAEGVRGALAGLSNFDYELVSLRVLVGDAVPPEVATRLRTTVLAAAAERRALWVYRNHGVATVPGIERRRYPTRTGTMVALGIAAVLAVIVGAVLAVVSSFAGP